MKIGIIREGKVPIDKRTPFTPQNCVLIKEMYPEIEIVVQPSTIRIILDEEYKALKIPLQEDLSDCDFIFGIKEIPPTELIANKTYFFFSHTIKKQPVNQKLIKKIIEKKCTLVDYECMRDEKGNRLVSFGHYAGVIGAYETIRMYGHRYRLFDIKPAQLCFDYAEMRSYFKKVKLKPIKIALTGGGRVANGAIQILNQIRIKQVNIYDYLNKTFNQPVFAQIHSEHFNVKKGTNFFDKKEFYKHPEKYESSFFEFAKQTDILLACAYWNQKAPLLFSKAEMRKNEFRIKMIGDITCDINGSIPSTMRASSIDNPVYDYNPFSEDLEVPFSSEKNITTMAVDNLPCELARDASHNFGIQLINMVLPEMLKKEMSAMIANATIVKDGKLTSKYEYLSDYALS